MSFLLVRSLGNFNIGALVSFVYNQRNCSQFSFVIYDVVFFGNMEGLHTYGLASQSQIE